MFSFLKRMTVAGRQWVLTGQFVVSLVVGGLLAMWITSTLGHTVARLLHTDLPAVKYVGEIEESLNRTQALVYRAIYFMGAKDESGAKETFSTFGSVKKQVAENFAQLDGAELPPTELESVKALHTKVKGHFELSERMIVASAAMKEDFVRSKIDEFEKSNRDTAESMDELNAIVDKMTASSNQAAEVLQSQSTYYNIFVTLTSLLISFWFSFYLIKNLNLDLNNVLGGIKGQSVKMTEVAHKFSASAESLASSTTQQTSALQETAATLDEISAMVKRTEENSKSLQESSARSQRSAEQGKNSVVEMTQAIESIQASVEQIIKQVDESNSQFAEVVDVIKNIGAKTKVINDIVFQTKLLSFNASVEAARAGEHGKGFAVVAQEIGNLAQMSGNAAQEIGDMLSTSVSRVEGIVNQNRSRIDTLMEDGKEKVATGTRVAKQTEGSLHEILDQSSQVNQMISEINASIFEQSRGVREIVSAITMMNSSTAEISKASEEGAVGSRELLSQGDHLNHYIGTLERLISKEAPQGYQPAPAHGHAPAPRASYDGKVVPMTARKPKQAPAPAPAAAPQELASTGTDHRVPSGDDPRFEDL